VIITDYFKPDDLKAPRYGCVQLVDLAITPKEISRLQTFAVEHHTWSWGSGRQKDSSYFKISLRREVQFGDTWASDMVDRLATEFVGPRSELIKSNAYWASFDAWLIYYPDRGFVKWHKDPVEDGKKHRRMNIVVTEPRAGGSLRLFVPSRGSSFCNDYEPADQIELWPSAGQGVIFEPSEVEHMVSENRGGRLVLSIGMLLDR
jgi:hypothetical protein